MGPRSFKLMFLAVSAVFAFLMFLVPFLSPYGSLTGLDGTPGFIDHWDIWSTKDPVSCVMYLIGDILCHQEMARSFILNGSQMPICIRDVGLLMGFVFLSAVIYLRDMIMLPDRKKIAFVIIAIALIVADWVFQFVTSIDVPVTRLITGFLAGAAADLILTMFIDRSFYGKG